MPDDESSFVGRAAELRRIGAALFRGQLVTLTGPGGVGKTRLARRVVALGTPAGVDGVAWADLSPLHNPALLAATVAGALGLSDHTARPPAEAVRSWVGARRILLVLDCCEHLPAACRELVGDLLTACPNLRVLATSREPLRVRGESVLPVEPPASVHEALALFADRAAAAGSPLKDEEDRELATALCERLERLPLALELAAAQLRAMPLAELCARPRAAVDLPVAPPYATPPRHAALRTTIGWSHELCGPVERLLWARLSHLPGRFDAHTACQVAAGGPLSPGAVRQHLAALCAKSVVTERHGTYRMLDAIREYGRRWLAALGETATVADRHAGHVLAETRRAHAEWFGPAQRGWYRRIAFLHSDLRLAADHLLATDPAAALELIGHVTFFWVCSGYLYETRQYLELAIRLVPDAGPDESRVQALWSLGLTRTLQGDHGPARETAVACRRAAAAALDAEGLARAAYLEGLLHLLEGRPLAALTVVEGPLREADGRDAESPASGPPEAEAEAEAEAATATALCRLVRIFALTGTGRLDQARSEALGLHEVCAASDEHWTRSYLDHQLALIAVLEGRTLDAVGHARAVLDAKRHIGDDFGIAMALDLLAIALSDAGEERSAAHAFGAALRFWETVGHPQRGTPEMAALRDACEERLVHALGRQEYDRLLDAAAEREPRALLSWATRGGPLPPR
ncbi:ATP-binding protein [Streptomyces sp. NPDC090075]|uniref:ATP-binding protein n=1 Tax=Streptomyces sp. NPDC090075 TaxID=3365937 RepID=UPI00381AEA11